MKRSVALIAALLTAASFGAYADDLSMDETAVDTVGVSYSTEGSVLLLGMVGNDNVSLSLSGGSYGASTPGARATLGGGAGFVTADGGYLRYTSYANTSQKITVQKDASTSLSYADNTLKVSVKGITAAGSGIGTLGTPNATTGNDTWVDIGSTATTLIGDIYGADTWTGTESGNGAQVSYKLVDDPGVTTVVVLYTILSEAI